MTRPRVLQLLIAASLSWGFVLWARTVDPLELNLTVIEDSTTYFLYRYDAANPTSSTQGIAEVQVDLSANVGGGTLAATGAFRDLASISPLAVTPHVEVGPISPTNWRAALRRTGVLLWYGANGDMLDRDSVAPGDTLTGLGLRSSYFPGVRQVAAVPTWQSCCLEPWGDSISNPDRQHRNPDEFAVYSNTVGPAYHASEITVDLLQSQLSTVCTDPLWIDDSALCGALADSLDAAESRLTAEDVAGARDAIMAARDIVEANREPSGAIEGNAYWLLSLNLTQLLENLPEPGLPIWAASVSYVVGDEVSHQGLDYRCRQSHTSLTGWEPPNTYALWERINTGGQWAPQVIYVTNDVATYQGIDYRAIQGHQSQAGWEPPNQPALWVEVN